ncbi:MAG: hypothetical protein BLITH_0983 [Brockia lithotrophica]|uniref:Uncharacterized protein n=1 Tax=Brockia lithotrophica TaxID=933949 RepID=A0A2T5G750_9BACL|nr:MAG: hypothetical protein BLITH_0983 [Brockia lithotrophica]
MKSLDKQIRETEKEHPEGRSFRVSGRLPDGSMETSTAHLVRGKSNFAVPRVVSD